MNSKKGNNQTKLGEFFPKKFTSDQKKQIESNKIFVNSEQQVNPPLPKEAYLTPKKDDKSANKQDNIASSEGEAKNGKQESQFHKIMRKTSGQYEVLRDKNNNNNNNTNNNQNNNINYKYNPFNQNLKQDNNNIAKNKLKTIDYSTLNRNKTRQSQVNTTQEDDIENLSIDSQYNGTKQQQFISQSQQHLQVENEQQQQKKTQSSEKVYEQEYNSIQEEDYQDRQKQQDEEEEIFMSDDNINNNNNQNNLNKKREKDGNDSGFEEDFDNDREMKKQKNKIGMKKGGGIKLKNDPEQNNDPDANFKKIIEDTDIMGKIKDLVGQKQFPNNQDKKSTFTVLEDLNLILGYKELPEKWLEFKGYGPAFYKELLKYDIYCRKQRTHNSLRDRIKEYLRYLKKEDIQVIFNFTQQNPDKWHEQFIFFNQDKVNRRFLVCGKDKSIALKVQKHENFNKDLAEDEIDEVYDMINQESEKQQQEEQQQQQQQKDKNSSKKEKEIEKKKKQGNITEEEQEEEEKINQSQQQQQQQQQQVQNNEKNQETNRNESKDYYQYVMESEDSTIFSQDNFKKEINKTIQNNNQNQDQNRNPPVLKKQFFQQNYQKQQQYQPQEQNENERKIHDEQQQLQQQINDTIRVKINLNTFSQDSWESDQEKPQGVQQTNLFQKETSERFQKLFKKPSSNSKEIQKEADIKHQNNDKIPQSTSNKSSIRSKQFDILPKKKDKKRPREEFEQENYQYQNNNNIQDELDNGMNTKKLMENSFLPVETFNFQNLITKTAEGLLSKQKKGQKQEKDSKYSQESIYIYRKNLQNGQKQWQILAGEAQNYQNMIDETERLRGIYKLSEEEFFEKFSKVSFDVGDFEEVHNNGKQFLEWGDEEDKVLRDCKTEQNREFKLVQRYKGTDKIRKRCEFLGIQLPFEF